MLGIVIALGLLLLSHIKPVVVFSLAIVLILRRIFNAAGRGIDPDSAPLRYFISSASSNASMYADTIFARFYETYVLIKDWPWQSISMLAGAGIWVTQGFFKVDASERAIVLRCGKKNREVGPGMQWCIPIFETPINVNVARVNSLSKSSRIVTNDQGIVDVNATVFFTVDPDHIEDYKFKARSPESILSSITDSIIREVIACKRAEDCLTTERPSIEQEIRAKLDAKLAEYELGIIIQGVQVGKIDPPDSVVDANRSVADAQCEYTANKNKAEAHKNEEIPRAKGEAARLLYEAGVEKARIDYNATWRTENFKAWHELWKTDAEATRNIIIYRHILPRLKGAKITRIPSSLGVFGAETIAQLSCVHSKNGKFKNSKAT